MITANGQKRNNNNIKYSDCECVFRCTQTIYMVLFVRQTRWLNKQPNRNTFENRVLIELTLIGVIVSSIGLALFVGSDGEWRGLSMDSDARHIFIFTFG